MENNSQEHTRPREGAFIALEGIDGSGKSTQVRLLAERLAECKIDFYTTMEPTNGSIGLLLRRMLTGKEKADNRVMAALFAADRLDHLLNKENGIAAKVSGGAAVITDRYYFSSYAYHSVDMPMDWVIQANAQSRLILRPTATVFIDVPPETAMERILRNRGQQELYEEKARLEATREKYFEAFHKLKDTEHVILIDGTNSPEEIAADIWERLKPYFFRN